MSKISSIGSKAYFGGYDLSGDITGLGGIVSSVDFQDTSAIDSTAMERLMLRRDGSIAINAILNPSSGRSHPVLSALPSTEIDVMWAASTTLGDICAMLAAKQASYQFAIGTNGATQLTANALAAIGAALEWGNLLTAGQRTDSSATLSGTGIDRGIPPGESAVTITSASAANPTSVLTATAHGYTSGDSVIIAGTSKAALNDEFTITVVDATHFTVPVDLTSGGATGGTVTRTSTRSGWAAQLQAFSLASGSPGVKIQHAPKNTSGSFTDVTSGAFSTPTAASAQRIAGASTALLQRYVRIGTTGTFSNLVYAAGIAAPV